MPSDDEVSTWICPKCKCDLKKGGDNSATPVRGVPSQNSDSGEAAKPPKAQKALSKTEKSDAARGAPPQSLDACEAGKKLKGKQKAPSETEKMDLATLAGEMRSLRSMVDGFKSHFEKVISDSVAKLDERFGEMLARLSANEEKTAHIISENQSLKMQIAELENRLQSQSQSSHRNEVEIIGLHETPSENLSHLVLVAAKKVGVDLKYEDIDWIERAGPRRNKNTEAAESSTHNSKSNLPRPIVVRFTRRTARDQFLKSAKSRKSFMAGDLDDTIPNPTAKIYFNERLIREKRKLFRETRARAKAAGYKYCWTRNGLIYIRRKDDSPAVQIHNIDELTERFGEK